MPSARVSRMAEHLVAIGLFYFVVLLNPPFRSFSTQHKYGQCALAFLNCFCEDISGLSASRPGFRRFGFSLQSGYMPVASAEASLPRAWGVADQDAPSKAAAFDGWASVFYL